MNTMKTVQNNRNGSVSLGSRLIAAALAAAMFSSCVPALNPPPQAAEGAGQVILRLGSDTSRTLMPTSPDLFYDLRFRSGGKTDVVINKVHNIDGLAVTLDAGLWKVYIDAHREGESIASRAEAQFSVGDGKTVTVDITMAPVAWYEGGEGTFSWDIDFSALMSGNEQLEDVLRQADITVTDSSGESFGMLLWYYCYEAPANDKSPAVKEPPNKGENWKGWIVPKDGMPSKDGFPVTPDKEPESTPEAPVLVDKGSIKLTAGQYHISLRLLHQDGIRTASVDTVAHIYQGLETKLDCTNNTSALTFFTAADFAHVLPVLGEVEIQMPPDAGGISKQVWVQAFSDEKCTNAVSDPFPARQTGADKFKYYLKIPYEYAGSAYLQATMQIDLDSGVAQAPRPKTFQNNEPPGYTSPPSYISYDWRHDDSPSSGWVIVNTVISFIVGGGLTAMSFLGLDTIASFSWSEVAQAAHETYMRGLDNRLSSDASYSERSAIQIDEPTVGSSHEVDVQVSIDELGQVVGSSDEGGTIHWEYLGQQDPAPYSDSSAGSGAGGAAGSGGSAGSGSGSGSAEWVQSIEGYGGDGGAVRWFRPEGRVLHLHNWDVSTAQDPFSWCIEIPHVLPGEPPMYGASILSRSTAPRADTQTGSGSAAAGNYRLVLPNYNVKEVNGIPVQSISDGQIEDASSITFALPRGKIEKNDGSRRIPDNGLADANIAIPFHTVDYHFMNEQFDSLKLLIPDGCPTPYPEVWDSENWEFAAWYREEMVANTVTAGAVWNFTYPVMEDMSLMAEWTKPRNLIHLGMSEESPAWDEYIENAEGWQYSNKVYTIRGGNLLPPIMVTGNNLETGARIIIDNTEPVDVILVNAAIITDNSPCIEIGAGDKHVRIIPWGTSQAYTVDMGAEDNGSFYTIGQAVRKVDNQQFGNLLMTRAEGLASIWNWGSGKLMITTAPDVENAKPSMRNQGRLLAWGGIRTDPGTNSIIIQGYANVWARNTWRQGGGRAIGSFQNDHNTSIIIGQNAKVTADAVGPGAGIKGDAGSLTVQDNAQLVARGLGYETDGIQVDRLIIKDNAKVSAYGGSGTIINKKVKKPGAGIGVLHELRVNGTALGNPELLARGGNGIGGPGGDGLYSPVTDPGSTFWDHNYVQTVDFSGGSPLIRAYGGMGFTTLERKGNADSQYGGVKYFENENPADRNAGFKLSTNPMYAGWYGGLGAVLYKNLYGGINYGSSRGVFQGGPEGSIHECQVPPHGSHTISTPPQRFNKYTPGQYERGDGYNLPIRRGWGSLVLSGHGNDINKNFEYRWGGYTGN